MAERSLDTEVQFLKGVGPRNALALNKAGFHTAGDLLYVMPRRYEDRRHLPPIGQLRPGQWATVQGKLVNVDARQTNRGMVILKAVIRDATGHIALTWFNQPWIRRVLEKHEGDVLAYGLVKETSFGMEMAAPEWEPITEDDDSEDFARIVPVYPLTEGLSQKVMRRAAKSVVEHYLDLVQDPLPEELRRRYKLQKLRWCIRQIHMPESEEMRLEARRRLVFEEFFYLQVALAFRRAEMKQELGIAFPISQLLTGEIQRPAPAVKEPKKQRSAVVELPDHPVHLFEQDQRAKHEGAPLWEQIHEMLPFELTNAQRRVIQEIWADMERPYPMNRLVQGDVGSGKTAVAACCMLAAVRSGYQAALMAPTEILAEQHAVNLRALFEPLGIEVELLVGKLSAAQKRKAAERTSQGVTHIAVGTHALIQEGVGFHRLGLVIVDEQHRFGVLQRKALRDKGLGNPDVLVMTATPIPRTLTMTMYGDLELSVIDELPPGRKPIKTHWKLPFERQSVYLGVRKLIESGRQAYFVCPMVSESEKMLTQAAEELHRQLSTGVYEDMRVGLLHGQMKPKEKESVMESFRRHELDILVSTTVIEVGVDVPNSSVMVIEDATRFGLSQLHQLRGRVGRGGNQSFCILIADAKSEEARTRMEVMVATNDGFRISEEDLRLRGPGELAGTKQSGNLDFKIADLVQDGKMLEVARQAAMEAIERDPALSAPEWAGVLARVQERRSDMAVVTVS
ncbi:ATP-dependent DNA helicase RecG [Fimbriimonas ginsengisoli]|uniref:ATP-dependent DNA helicase RecG n=1 Tax=Fimbriimonas ginsengisoli Gsoil 348 TaxID=661478 RepID=A0A068NUB3_FIMGI|nr:ATP-dependent DNA helicase RecG [Fimbriimonas ginsengisoli]AIE87021.1 ATP-dependent DNA helicase RecG [Fimbriimonas ginsengisoli Gsoil 348]